MKSTSTGKSTVQDEDKKRTFTINTASFGAFALSMLIHGMVILVVGGYVIFEGIVPKSSFLPMDGGVSSIDTEVLPPPEEPVDSMAQPTVNNSELLPSTSESASVSGEATSADILVSSAPHTSFHLAPAVGVVAVTPKMGFGGGGTKDNEGSGGGQGPTGPRTSNIRSLFGSSEPVSGRMVGTLFDFKQTKDRQPIPGAEAAIHRDFTANVSAFIGSQGKAGFKRRGILDKFYSAPTTLYATHLHIFGVEADDAPAAFSVADTVEPRNWVIHYAAMVKPPKSGWFRFVGAADDYIAVGWDRKLVLDKPFSARSYVLAHNSAPAASGGRPGAPVYPATVYVGRKFDPLKTDIKLGYSEWIEMSDAREYRLDVLIGERPGGGFYANLMIEELGVNYRLSPEGVPQYPIFKTVPKVKLSTANKYYPADEDGPVFTVTRAADVD